MSFPESCHFLPQNLYSKSNYVALTCRIVKCIKGVVCSILRKNLNIIYRLRCFLYKPGQRGRVVMNCMGSQEQEINPYSLPTLKSVNYTIKARAQCEAVTENLPSIIQLCEPVTDTKESWFIDYMKFKIKISLVKSSNTAICFQVWPPT